MFTVIAKSTIEQKIYINTSVTPKLYLEGL